MLKLADNLKLPTDAVTQAVGILAKRRAGKSYCARRFAEQLYHAQQQIVIVDPKGDWWGIRSSADGKGPGLPIVILGGERGDVPLESGGGEVVAKLVVEERVSVLLDLSFLRKHEVATFMTAFLENLYRLKAKEIYRTPVMLIIDEADAVAPQSPMKGEERMLGAAEDIVRRGGQRGIGCTLITQRSAVLNKNVLTQVQMLIALRTIAPQDLKAVNAWIDVHGSEAERKTLMESLPALPTGDAWFWSPGWPTTDGIFVRGHVLPIETFDSGATPKPGEKRREPKNIADVDLAALTRQMADTIERAKADDPKELRKQIADLKRQAAAKPAATIDQSAIDRAVAAAIAQRDREFAAAIAERDKIIGTMRGRIGKAQAKAGELTTLLHLNGEATPAAVPKMSIASLTVKPAKQAPIVPPRQKVSIAQSTASDQSIGKCERGILQVLAQFPEGCEIGKLALLSGYRVSGGFRNSLSALRTAGMIEGENTGTMTITTAGEAAGPFDALPVGPALADYWLTNRNFGKCERAILAALLEQPDGMGIDDLAAATSYEVSGGFRNSLSTLRTAGVLVGRNTETMKASDELF